MTVLCTGHVPGCGSCAGELPGRRDRVREQQRAAGARAALPHHLPTAAYPERGAVPLSFLPSISEDAAGFCCSTAAPHFKLLAFRCLSCCTAVLLQAADATLAREAQRQSGFETDTQGSVKKKRKAAADEAAAPDAAAPQQLLVESYAPADPGPYPADVPPQNPVRFTPVQVEAIKSGTQHGLTLVVGPPGSRTDPQSSWIASCFARTSTWRNCGMFLLACPRHAPLEYMYHI